MPDRIFSGRGKWIAYFSVFAVPKGEGYAKAAQFLVPKDAQMNCRTIA
ncbi:hypothetical protein ACPPVO_19835 [Dactylosporangium sp. McL0621]